MKKGELTRRPVLWAPFAEADLLNIWSYVAAESLASTADRTVKEIHRLAYLLGGYPEFGRPRDDVRTGLRSVLAQRYVIFYRIKPDAIEIVRVLDERRDVDSIFSYGA
jgi:toxin ParE1/3/4